MLVLCSVFQVVFIIIIIIMRVRIELVGIELVGSVGIELGGA